MNKRRIGSTALEFTEVSFGGAALGGLYRLFVRGGDGNATHAGTRLTKISQPHDLQKEWIFHIDCMMELIFRTLRGSGGFERAMAIGKEASSMSSQSRTNTKHCLRRPN